MFLVATNLQTQSQWILSLEALAADKLRENKTVYTRVMFYVRRIGLYLYKYGIYGTISIYILKGLASV